MRLRPSRRGYLIHWTQNGCPRTQDAELVRGTLIRLRQPYGLRKSIVLTEFVACKLIGAFPPSVSRVPLWQTSRIYIPQYSASLHLDIDRNSIYPVFSTPSRLTCIHCLKNKLTERTRLKIQLLLCHQARLGRSPFVPIHRMESEECILGVL